MFQHIASVVLCSDAKGLIFQLGCINAEFSAEDFVLWKKFSQPL